MMRLAALALATLLTACTVVSIDDDRDRRAQREAGFDAAAFVARNWNSRIVPEIEKGALPVETLLSGIAKGVTASGQAKGRIASEGSPEVFKVRGAGTIAATDSVSRIGGVAVRLPSGALVRVYTGPFVVSSSVRDALPFIDFNNFADQMAYAAVGKALNARAFRAVPAGLKPGDRIAFTGVATTPGTDMALAIMPVKIERAN